MNRARDLLLLICWIIIIFLLTGYPGLESPKIKEFPMDKFYHFFLFFIYGLLAIRLMPILYYIVSGLLVIFTAEFQQIFVPGREFEVLDIVAGIIGLFTILTIYKKYKK